MKLRCIGVIWVFILSLIIGVVYSATGSEVDSPDTTGIDCPDNIGPGADLRNCDLSEANLESVDLSGANLRGANLVATNLKGANLQSANLLDARLDAAIMNGVNLSGSSLRRASFRDANLKGANLSKADLHSAFFYNANLDDANLTGVDLTVCRTDSASMKGADLTDAKVWITETLPDGSVVKKTSDGFIAYKSRKDGPRGKITPDFYFIYIACLFYFASFTRFYIRAWKLMWRWKTSDSKPHLPSMKSTAPSLKRNVNLMQVFFVIPFLESCIYVAEMFTIHLDARINGLHYEWSQGFGMLMTIFLLPRLFFVVTSMVLIRKGRRQLPEDDHFFDYTESFDKALKRKDQEPNFYLMYLNMKTICKRPLQKIEDEGFFKRAKIQIIIMLVFSALPIITMLLFLPLYRS